VGAYVCVWNHVARAIRLPELWDKERPVPCVPSLSQQLYSEFMSITLFFITSHHSEERPRTSTKMVGFDVDHCVMY
jgi:hypothetical protein